MGQLLFLAGLSVGLVLAQYSDFLQKAGVEAPLPLSEDVLVQSIVRTNEEMMSTRVLGRYYLSYFKGKVRVFADRDENIHHTLSRLDPHEMTELSKQHSLIDEEEARQLACDAFFKLGFQDSDFEPPVVHRFTYQPSEFDPHVLSLPFFHVQWNLKGEHQGDMLDPCTAMIVSGRTKHLIFYDISSLARFNR